MKKAILFLLLVTALTLALVPTATAQNCYYPYYGGNCYYNNCNYNYNCYPNYPSRGYCAAFISDVTYADGTYVAPGSSFVKTWRLRNNSAYTWNSNYRLVFSSGNQMSAPYSVNLPYNVAPGQTVDISVPMVAPATGGTHKGVWMLQSDTGVNFGVGYGCNTGIWVQITTTQKTYPYYGPTYPYPQPQPQRPPRWWEDYNPKPQPMPTPQPRPTAQPFPFPWQNQGPWYPVN